jgi:hypothetical protein
MTIQLKIKNRNKANQYEGQYARIFKLLNRGAIFCEAYYETDESIGLVDGDYFLEISSAPDADQMSTILGFPNVTLLN